MPSIKILACFDSFCGSDLVFAVSGLWIIMAGYVDCSISSEGKHRTKHCY